VRAGFSAEAGQRIDLRTSLTILNWPESLTCSLDGGAGLG